jgi:hypothetical protein
MKANEQMDKYAQTFSDAVINNLMRTKMKGFFDGDPIA